MKNVFIVIFFIICIGILIGMFVISNNKTEENNSITNALNISNNNTSNVVNENKNISNTNTEVENVVNNTENNTENTNVSEENLVTNETQNNTIPESDNSEETTVDYDDSKDKEIAISIAEKEWGEDDTVYYTNEGVVDGKYRVAVRDKSNTSVKLYYKVDITNKSVEIEW